MGNDIIIRERESVKHGKTYEYRFEIASINGKRQWKSKSDFLSAKAAKKADTTTLAKYNACGKIFEPTQAYARSSASIRITITLILTFFINNIKMSKDPTVSTSPIKRKQFYKSIVLF